MQIGAFLGSQGTLAQLGDEMEAAAKLDGITSLWLPQIFSFDALTAIAALAHRAPGVELGTSVIPTYPRHPMMLAAQALTAQSATDNRVVLGIGLSLAHTFVDASFDPNKPQPYTWFAINGTYHALGLLIVALWQ